MVLYGEKKQAIGTILKKLCEWKGVEIHQAESCPDHIHMLVSIQSKISVIWISIRRSTATWQTAERPKPDEGGNHREESASRLSRLKARTEKIPKKLSHGTAASALRPYIHAGHEKRPANETILRPSAQYRMIEWRNLQ